MYFRECGSDHLDGLNIFIRALFGSRVRNCGEDPFLRMPVFTKFFTLVLVPYFLHLAVLKNAICMMPSLLLATNMTFVDVLGQNESLPYMPQELGCEFFQHY